MSAGRGGTGAGQRGNNEVSGDPGTASLDTSLRGGAGQVRHSDRKLVARQASSF